MLCSGTLYVDVLSVVPFFITKGIEWAALLMRWALVWTTKERTAECRSSAYYGQAQVEK